MRNRPVMTAAFFAIGAWGAPELGGPDDQGVVEHAALAEVLQKAGDWLVDILRVFGVFRHVAVLIPVVAGGAVDEFDEADTTFHQAAGDKAGPPEAIGLSPFHPVEFKGGVALP